MGWGLWGGCRCCCVVTYQYTLRGCNSLPLAGVPIAATKAGQPTVSATTDASGFATFTTPSIGWTVTPAPGIRFGAGSPSTTGSATCGNTLASTITYPAGTWTAGHGPTPLDSTGYYCVPTCVQPIPPSLTLTSPLGTTRLPQRGSGGVASGHWGEGGSISPSRTLAFARLSGSVAGSVMTFTTPPGGYFCAASGTTVTASEWYTLFADAGNWRLMKRWYVCPLVAGGTGAPIDDADPNASGAPTAVQQVTAAYGCSPVALSFTFTQGISTGVVTIAEDSGQ